MAYGGVPLTGGVRKIVPICQPGQDIEACRRDLLEKTGEPGSLPALFFVAALAIIGDTCWFVLSGRWTLILIELEQRIRSLRR